jgi:hypothetical protein
MRLSLLAAAFAGVLTGAAAAQQGPNAREAYVERRGLIEADMQCRLFSPSIRDALEVSAAQTRGALLRAGWTDARMRELDAAIVASAQGRACADARTVQAAASARRSVSQWLNAGSMEFAGWERTWVARRIGEGWRLSQSIDGPMPAVFGVLQHGQTQRLSLVIPIARGAAAPVAARLIMRNPARPRRGEVGLTQRMAMGLEAGAPSPANSASAPSTRSIERLSDGRMQAVFAFPDSAFRDLLALDPRESVEIRVDGGRGSQRLLVEVGDIAAARAFLTIRR